MLSRQRPSTFPGVWSYFSIRTALSRANIFVLLVSPDSLRPGAYALTELQLAQAKWPRPAGHILPVLVNEIPLDSLPNYLSSVSVLEPQGDLVAEVVNAVCRLAGRIRKILWARILAVGLLLLALLSLGLMWNRLPWATRRFEVKDISVSRIENEKGYRFTSTLRNAGTEAITAVEVYPKADLPDIEFSGTSENIDINPGKENSASVNFDFAKGNATSQFKWRMCWRVVNTSALLEFEESGSKEDFETWLLTPTTDGHPRSEIVCSSYRPWLIPLKGQR